MLEPLFRWIHDFLLSPHALKYISCALGTAGLSVCAIGLTRFEQYRSFIRDLPRNQTWARVLLLVDVVWSAPLTLNFLRSMEVPPQIYGIDLAVLIYFVIAPAAFIYILIFVNNYLGARTAGWFLILLAKPVLLACLVRDTPAKFVLVVMAYLWVVWGMLMIAVPHFLRDVIAFHLEKPAVLRRSLRFKGFLGLALIALGVFVF